MDELADRRIAEVGRDAWDACARNPAYAGNPFIRFDFLDATEEARCAVERTGWGPQHLSVEDAAGRVAAVMPLYLKSHSQGEYIFDHSWRQFKEKLIFPDLQKVDWDYYYGAYKRLLPYINNNYDFAEMLSEMLGEMNVSHTGAYYNANFPNTDATASLEAPPSSASSARD